MKLPFISFLLIGLACFTTYAQCNKNYLTTIIPDSGIVYGHGNFMSNDANENLYVSLRFTHNLSIGNTKLEAPLNETNIALLKFNELGNLEWALQSSPPTKAYLYSQEIDANGNIYLVGTFDQVLSFGAFTLTTNNSGLFAAKVTPNGIIDFVHLIAEFKPNEGFPNQTRIFPEALGNYTVAGTAFGSFLFDTTVFDFGGNQHLFFATYSPTGKLKSLKKDVYTTSTIQLIGIERSNDSSFIATGSFTNHLRYGSNIIVNQSAANATDIFIIKYSKDATVDWIKTLGGLGSISALNFKLDKMSSIYISGRFSGNMMYDDTTFSTSLSSAHNFVIRIDEQGQLKWFKPYHPTGNTPVNLSFIPLLNQNMVMSGMISVSLYFAGLEFSTPGKQVYSFLHFTSPDGNYISNRVFTSSEFFSVSNGVALNNTDVAFWGYFISDAQLAGNQQINMPGQKGYVLWRTCTDHILSTEKPKRDKVFHPQLICYPNPTNNNLFMELAANDDYEITVSDISGRVQLRETYSTRGHSTTFELNCSTLSNGMYFIRVNSKKSFSGYAKFYKN